MNCEQQDCGNDESLPVTLSLADRWIQSRLQQTAREVEHAIAQFRFDHATQALYEFIWNEYCDWYLELSKPVLWDDQASAEALRGTRRTLIRVLETWLRLLHPFMPFITEEIWQRVAPLAGKTGPTIMLQPYPHSEDKAIDSVANADIEWLKSIIIGIRNIRGEMNIAPGRLLSLLFRNGSDSDARRLHDNASYLKKLARLERTDWLEAGEEAPVAATALVGELEILVPMAGLIDKDQELARLGREIGKLEQELARLEKKLGNSAFVDKAPVDVVAKERDKLESQQQALGKLRSQAEHIARL
jgi:valyl-tRNA synthetase